MEKANKYKILLIEPSEIIATGIQAIIARNPEFTVLQTLTNPGYYNAQSCDADIIIINPPVIDYNE